MTKKALTSSLLALGALFTLGRTANAIPPICCNNETYECDYATGAHECSPNPCDEGWTCAEPVLACEFKSKCQIGPCECLNNIAITCCEALGGTPTQNCWCDATKSPSNKPAVIQDHSSPNDSSITGYSRSAWLLAMPLVALASMAPLALRKRRRS